MPSTRHADQYLYIAYLSFSLFPNVTDNNYYNTSLFPRYDKRYKLSWSWSFIDWSSALKLTAITSAEKKILCSKYPKSLGRKWWSTLNSSLTWLKRQILQMTGFIMHTTTTTYALYCKSVTSFCTPSQPTDSVYTVQYCILLYQILKINELVFETVMMTHEPYDLRLILYNN